MKILSKACLVILTSMGLFGCSSPLEKQIKADDKDGDGIIDTIGDIFNPYKHYFYEAPASFQYIKTIDGILKADLSDPYELKKAIHQYQRARGCIRESFSAVGFHKDEEFFDRAEHYINQVEVYAEKINSIKNDLDKVANTSPHKYNCDYYGDEVSKKFFPYKINTSAEARLDSNILKGIKAELYGPFRARYSDSDYMYKQFKELAVAFKDLVDADARHEESIRPKAQNYVNLNYCLEGYLKFRNYFDLLKSMPKLQAAILDSTVNSKNFDNVKKITDNMVIVPDEKTINTCKFLHNEVI